MNNPDFQIIGGGLIGLSTAYALIKRGKTVRVIEALEGPGLGTSYANAAMVHAAQTDPWNSPGVGKQLLASLFDPGSPMKLRPQYLPGLIGWGLKFLRYSSADRHLAATKNNYRLAEYSARLINEWRDELGLDLDHKGTGILKIFRNAENFHKTRAMNEKLAPMGLNCEIVDPRGCTAIEPYLAPIQDKLVGGLMFPDDYGGDAYRFCTGLAGAITAKGGEICCGVQADKLIKTGGIITGVQTDQGRFLAGHTIIAAGAKSYKYLAGAGINISVRPVKGYSLTFDELPGPTMPVADEALHAAVTPLGNRMRIAGTAEITGFDKSLKPNRLRPLLGLLQGVYPELAADLKYEDGKPWTGYRPMSADGVPYIGKTALEGLSVNTGQGHLGWTFSAGSGALLADILVGEEAKIDEAAFGIGR